MRRAINPKTVARAFQNLEPGGIAHPIASAERPVASITARAPSDDEGTDSEVSV
jgi:DNA-binding transcriptional regulator YhcF (GntR family)